MNLPHEKLAALAILLFCSAASPAQTCGDCNGDGILSILDALLAAQIGVMLVQPTPIQDQLCDVDASGTIAVIDALLLAQEAAGLGPALSCPPPPVEPEWVRSAGTLGYDRGHAVASDNDVIYLAGSKNFAALSSADGWLMARSSDGTLLWERVLQIPGGGGLELLGIAAGGGSIYAAGVRRVSLSPAGPDDVDLVVIELDASGAVLRQTQIVAPTTHEHLRSLTILNDGSLLVLADRTPSAGGLGQAWILNLEATGAIRWQKELSTADGCQLSRAFERSTTGTFVAGRISAPGSGGFDGFGWLLSLDAAGTLLWQNDYQPPAAGNGFTDLLVDGTGVWLVGYICESCFFTDDYWRVRTDLTGAMVSSSIFGNYTATFFDRWNRILPLASGGFATVGSTETLPVTGRFATVHAFDSSGAPLWARAFGESPRFTQSFDAALTAAGAIAFTGTSNLVTSASLSDAYFGKILPQSTALDGCPSATTLTDVASDITASVTVTSPRGVTETVTSATTVDPGLTLAPASPLPVDVVHCTN